MFSQNTNRLLPISVYIMIPLPHIPGNIMWFLLSVCTKVKLSPPPISLAISCGFSCQSVQKSNYPPLPHPWQYHVVSPISLYKSRTIPPSHIPGNIMWFLLSVCTKVELSPPPTISRVLSWWENDICVCVKYGKMTFWSEKSVKMKFLSVTSLGKWHFGLSELWENGILVSELWENDILVCDKSGKMTLWSVTGMGKWHFRLWQVWENDIFASDKSVKMALWSVTGMGKWHCGLWQVWENGIVVCDRSGKMTLWSVTGLGKWYFSWEWFVSR